VRNRFLGWLTGGLFFALLGPLIISSILLVKYFNFQLSIQENRFYDSSLENSYAREAEFDDWSNQIKERIGKQVMQLVKRIRKSLKPKDLPSYEEMLRQNDPDLDEFRNRLEEKLRHKNLLYLNRAKRSILAQFPDLDQMEFHIQYYSVDLSIKFLSSNRSIRLPELTKLQAFLDPDGYKYSADNMLSSFVMMFHRAQLGDIRNKEMVVTLRSMNVVDVLKDHGKFIPFSVPPFHYELLLEPIVPSKKFLDSLYQPWLEEIVAQRSSEFPKANGYLGASLYLEKIFKRKMNEFPEKGLGDYELMTRSIKSIRIPNTLDSAANFEVYRESSSTYELIDKEQLKQELLKLERPLRFSYRPEGPLRKERVHCLATTSRLYSSFIHLYQINENNLLSDTRTFMIQTVVSISLVLGIILLFGLALAYGISRPITSISNKVLVAARKLDFNPIREVESRFREITILKNAFTRKIQEVQLQARSYEVLSEVQDLLMEDPSQQRFLSTMSRIYREQFSLVLKSYNAQEGKIVFEKEPEDVLDLEAQEQAAPFHEQVHFYFERKKLEQNYMKSLRQEQELGLAQQIQESLLPREFQPKAPLEVASFFKPARYLGGDFWDAIHLENEDCLIVADVSGKGLASALYGASVKAYLQAFALTAEGPKELAGRINENMCRTGQEGYFCTAFLAFINHEGNKLRFASAGHNRMYLVRDSKVQDLSGKGLPFGLFDSMNYLEVEMDLQADDLIVLYTDGVNELENNNKQLYGLERLEDILESNFHLSSEELSEILRSDLELFRSQAEQSDDITYLIIKMKE